MYGFTETNSGELTCFYSDNSALVDDQKLEAIQVEPGVHKSI